jgi:hypothetical protein
VPPNKALQPTARKQPRASAELGRWAVNILDRVNFMKPIFTLPYGAETDSRSTGSIRRIEAR